RPGPALTHTNAPNTNGTSTGQGNPRQGNTGEGNTRERHRDQDITGQGNTDEGNAGQSNPGEGSLVATGDGDQNTIGLASLAAADLHDTDTAGSCAADREAPGAEEDEANGGNGYADLGNVP
ncbi:hypothetical protein, partial [Pseudarthrobacter sp. B4EP4b]|uniref:hypothetical protein n=1 Tax=Pseudarthrobacter sp. B4EP4b TaxID=2590664 RepID=UPI001C66783A